MALKKKLMLVESDDSWAALITKLLESKYQVIHSSTAQQAIDELDEAVHGAVILNFQLIPNNGAEFLNERVSSADLMSIPCIVYSDIQDIDSVSEEVWRAYGVSAYLRKVDLSDSLLSEVDKV